VVLDVVPGEAFSTLAHPEAGISFSVEAVNA
jgi:hypothetical protein